jgi:crotonobetainyl-CoA:carnitine CoA-transferase CaiB-like acyl-CoA transferase
MEHPMTAPLAGLTIIDFTPLLPGPFATRMLADMGARVIRIESADRPDLVRNLPPFVGGVSALHAYLNRNKDSLALDLKAPGAVEAVMALLSRADVLVEAFRPGVMERLGLGYAEVAKAHPQLIYCSITGFGQDGPLRERAGHDNGYQALSGLLGACGRPQGGPPPLSFQPGDLSGSLHAVIGMLAALRQRDRDGLGQHIDISLTDCAFHFNPVAASAALAGHDSAPSRELLNGGSHYDYYATRDGRWLAVGSLEPQFVQALALAVDLPELPRQLGREPEAAKAALAARLGEADFAHWRAVFAATEACVEPVLTPVEAVNSPLAAARGWVVGVPENGMTQPQPGLPIHFSRARPVYEKAGGAVGADNAALAEEFGLALPPTNQ